MNYVIMHNKCFQTVCTIWSVDPKPPGDKMFCFHCTGHHPIEEFRTRPLNEEKDDEN